MAESNDRNDLPRLAGPLRPIVDFAAGIKAGVHAKLLAGFLFGALLLVVLGVLSLTVISRMGLRVDELVRLQEKVDLTRQMEYAVTAQSHFRAMALLTLDDANNVKLANAKVGFLDNLAAMEDWSGQDQDEFFLTVRETNDRFGASGDRVFDLYNAKDIDASLKLHIAEEHSISHELEAQMRVLEVQATDQAAEAVASFESDRGFLTAMVWTFSVASIVFAVLVGLVLSWAFVRPLRRIEGAVAGVAAGDFSPRVEVLNRDEFGTLGANVNRMTMRLGNLYDDIQDELAERKRTEQELQGRAVELVAMNNELESMSYSLSHDVWAPMREIDTAGRELEERYGERAGRGGQERASPGQGRQQPDEGSHRRDGEYVPRAEPGRRRRPGHAPRESGPERPRPVCGRRPARAESRTHGGVGDPRGHRGRW
jgi:HAMP domain-containing protein